MDIKYNLYPCILQPESWLDVHHPLMHCLPIFFVSGCTGAGCRGFGCDWEQLVWKLWLLKTTPGTKISASLNPFPWPISREVRKLCSDYPISPVSIFDSSCFKFDKHLLNNGINTGLGTQRSQWKSGLCWSRLVLSSHFYMRSEKSQPLERSLLNLRKRYLPSPGAPSSTHPAKITPRGA